MPITIHITYRGQSGAARLFAQEMTSAGVVSAIRAQEGCLAYAYYLPMDDDEAVLLMDSWASQQALDRHHASPMMAQIAALREKYSLSMTVERFIPDEAGIPDRDRAFIRP
ncbi:MAG: antibiotic biosynthesis monooxygenase [Clostridia bacterium]|nr:antibiotic biosynthesis monooxygenase [Clostridia bacterium]